MTIRSLRACQLVCTKFILTAISFIILFGVFGINVVHGEKLDSTHNSSDSTGTGHHEGNNSMKDNHGSHGDGDGGGGHGHGTEGLYVASINYEGIRDPLIFTIVILLVSVSKIGYHHANFLSSKVPESCILIILGTIFGVIIYVSGLSDELPKFFAPHEFFIYLLPPIILEASFSLHDRTFGENLGSVLLFAVVGTILACAFIGLSLFGLAKVGAMGSIPDMGFVEVMVFASLIVAVDPVAVLAVFNEVGVNHVLYFLVFGESLLNDGVTVVLYKVFQAYNVMDEITGVHIFLGIVKFFVVCIGGLVLGILAGLASALLTKTTKHVKVAQPMIIYTMAYLGFLMAELFEFSGIISIVGCGLVQKQYAFYNISDKSATTIKYFTKVISTMCEIIIFLFLGLSIVNDEHDFHAGFTIWTIVLCLVFRFIIIFSMTFLINWLDVTRVRKISLHEQFMIAYGGLRGAVCFSLVALLSPHEFPLKNMFVTTTIAVILFTVFLQGISIKPLVYLLQITLAPEKNSSMYVELNSTVTDHLMAGVEEIIGDHGKNHIRERLAHIDKEYLHPIFTVEQDPGATQLKEFYEHLILKEHLKYLKLSGARDMQNMPELPHVTTELFLSTLGHHHKGVAGEATAKESPLKEEEEEEEEEPPTLTPTWISEDAGKKVQLRRRGPTRRSISYAPGEKLVASSRDLRNLLLSQKNSRMTLTSFDPNLTRHRGIGTEIRKKSHQNRRLQRMFSSSEEDGDTEDRKKRLSWSESEAEVCRTRGESMKRSKPPPRHCLTVDLSSSMAEGNSGHVSDPLLPMRPLGSPQSGTLASVREEENAQAETEIGPRMHWQEDSVEVEDEEEEEEEELSEGGLARRRSSSKHKLKRQGGMDQQSYSTSRRDDKKEDGGSGGSGGGMPKERESGSGGGGGGDGDGA